MNRAITNLVENAIKYTPENGRVDIEVDSQPEQVWIHIKDTGVGIPEDELEHIFDRFARSRNNIASEIDSSGLGLSIVQRIITLHGGEISAVSKLGSGSTFSLWIPSAPQEGASTDQSAQSLDA